MYARSPNFKLTVMTPLSIHHNSQDVEDEPFDLETERSKISFNENLIVCTYKPSQSVTTIQRTIQKLKGRPDIEWINPSFKGQIRKRTTSILRNFPSPTKISSIQL